MPSQLQSRWSPFRLRCKTTPFLHLAPCFPRPPVQNHPVFAPGTAFPLSSGAKPPRFCTRPGVFPALRCKTAPFPHLAPRFPRPPVQNHPVLAPGPVFSPPSGAKPPPFRTWHRVFPVLRCKTTPFLHRAPCFPRPPVQNHPVFAPGAVLSPPSGAKPPRFCTWRRAFPALRCKTTPFLHLAPCFPRPPVQNHPVFAPGAAFSRPPQIQGRGGKVVIHRMLRKRGCPENNTLF